MIQQQLKSRILFAEPWIHGPGCRIQDPRSSILDQVPWCWACLSPKAWFWDPTPTPSHSLNDNKKHDSITIEIQDLVCRTLDPWSPKSRILDQVPWCWACLSLKAWFWAPTPTPSHSLDDKNYMIREQVKSRILFAEPWIRGPGSRIQDPRSRILDQVPWCWAWLLPEACISRPYPYPQSQSKS